MSGHRPADMTRKLLASAALALPYAISAGLTAALSTQPNNVATSDSASIYWFSLSKSC